MFDEHSLVLDDLSARLAEPHRVYHGQAHIDALLADFQAPRDVFHLPDAVEVAIWFHDAVYAPSAGDNERRSASLLRATLDGLIPAPTLAAAEAMVLATEHHIVPPDLSPTLAADVAAFLDMDMAILEAPSAAYDRYAEGVAREFIPVVGEVAYRQGRTAFLRGAFEAGRPLFLTTQSPFDNYGFTARRSINPLMATSICGLGQVHAGLVVPDQPSMSGHPPQGSLDDPTSRENHECRFASLDDVESEIEERCFAHQLASIVGLSAKSCLIQGHLLWSASSTACASAPSEMLAEVSVCPAT